MSNDETPENTFDPIQSTIGSFGRWQLFVTVFILLNKFPIGWFQVSTIFLAPKPSFTCNDTSLDKCSDDCLMHVYDKSVFTSTIITEWDLVCKDEYLASIAQTIFMAGILVGSVLFGIIADKIGRRIPIIVAVVLELCFGVIASFSPAFWFFCLFRFLLAVAVGGTMNTSFVLNMEIIGTSWRELISVIYQVPFFLGHFVLPAFAYFLRDWDKLQLALSLYCLVLLSYFWTIPESPRWLLATNHTPQAIFVLETAAKCNKLPHESIGPNIIAYKEQLAAKVDKTVKVRTGNAWDLVRTSNMRKKTLCMCYLWFLCGMCFFGVTVYTGLLAGNIFVNVAVTAAIELPSTVICVFAMKIFGRKRPLMAANFLSGIALICIGFVAEDNIVLIIALVAVGIIGISIAFIIVYLFAGEIFPTVVRNIGIGICSMSARIGSMSAPFVNHLASTAFWLPPFIFGLVAMGGVVCTLKLPETKNAKLPDTIEDGENFGKSAKNDNVDNDNVKNDNVNNDNVNNDNKNDD